MRQYEDLDKIAITVKSHRILKKLLSENPLLETIMQNSNNETEALVGVRNWVLTELRSNPAALAYYQGEATGRHAFESMTWRDYAAIRLLDYIDNAGREFIDLNLRGNIAVSNPIRMIWLGVRKGTGGAKPFFFEDMLHLFRQFSGRTSRKPPSRAEVEAWMDRFPSGLDPRIVKLREENRDRILNILIRKIETGEIRSGRFTFGSGQSTEQKFLTALEWWKDMRFHLAFAVRSADLLNELLGFSLDPDTMKVLYDAEKHKIPFFINPYYLSLLHVRVPYFAIGADLAIRYYVTYSQELVDEFGNIVAWEKEDKVEPGKPNVAGWILPSEHNIHRRYPDVAILIPDTMGRACGGLCSSCQRMFDFQKGRLNFNLDALKPDKTWDEKLADLMTYFETDSQLRDILITGGDALMSSDASLKKILDEVAAMAERKRDANLSRTDGDKFAEITRVRLGTRLPAYLPQRITPELQAILREFKERASTIGIRQFIIQTHFEAPMEVTPEARDGIHRLIEAGWTVTNQHVFTTAASRRGHNAKLRQVLNDVGVLPYYTFTVKGYMENHFNFVPNARAVQEQVEEKCFGTVPPEFHDRIRDFPLDAQSMTGQIETLRRDAELPFVATDRNVLNLPGVGKSLTFRVIGITRYGRRILEFDHDRTRNHSPIIEKMGKVIIIESKSVSEYLRQLSDLGEEIDEYEAVYGYSMGETEARLPVFDYPDYDFRITHSMTNLQIE